MSLRRRLERLEANEASASEACEMPRDLQRFFRVVENTRRELDGLKPLPDLPYTEEDYHSDLETIATYRANPGWQTAEARAFLDEWEQRTLEKGRTLAC